MSDKITYSVNCSDMAKIASHLLRADSTFEIALSSRVDILVYAQKIHERAVRFEAFLGDELVGLVASYCNQPELGKSFVTSVSVLPDSQGLGIAGQLMRQCIDYVRDLGFCQIVLEVGKCSLPAIALYQKLGFIIICNSGSMLIMGMTLKRKVI